MARHLFTSRAAKGIWLHVLRRFNKEADALANAGMDRPAEDAADFNIRPMPEDKAPS